VGRIAFVVLVGSLAGLILVSGSGRSSLYSFDDPRLLVPVGADGKAQALEYKEYWRRLSSLVNAADNRKKADGKENSDRLEILSRIERAQSKKLSPIETTALAADLLRAGRVDEAQNRLAARLRDPRPDYFVLTTYASIRATAGDFAEALRYHTAAQLDSEMPPTVKGLTKGQRDWWEKLDRDYVPHYYRLRQKEVAERKNATRLEVEKLDETEDVFPLFPLPNTHLQPVRFVNDAGAYQPGQLAAEERKKLPPDAISIVQQLLFWFPSDNRLYWLLAELYAAEGDYAASFSTFHSLSWGRAYGNRPVMMAHRQAVESALNAQPRKPAADDVPLVQSPETQQPTPPNQPEPISMKTVWIYFGVVGLIAAFAFIRAMSRRAKGDCGPVG
jgi:hypothetical protein